MNPQVAQATKLLDEVFEKKRERDKRAREVASSCPRELRVVLMRLILLRWREWFAADWFRHDSNRYWDELSSVIDVLQILFNAVCKKSQLLSPEEALALCHDATFALEATTTFDRSMLNISGMVAGLSFPLHLTKLLAGSLENQSIPLPLHNALELWDELLSQLGSEAQKHRELLNDVLERDTPRLPALGVPWADALREDLAKMSEVQSTAWRRLLSHARRSESPKPTQKWLREAEISFRSIGATEFAAHLQRWLELAARGSEPLEGARTEFLKGLVWCASLDKNENTTRTIGRFAQVCWKKVPGVAARSTRLGNACLWSLGVMPNGVEQLARLQAGIKTNTAQKAVNKALLAAATRAGITPDELAELAVDNFGMSEVGIVEQQLAGYSVTIDFNATRTGVWSWISPAGKEQKSVPEAVKREAASELKALKNVAADVPKSLPAQRERLEKLLLLEKTWLFSTWQERYLNHPLMALLARRLIWRFQDQEETIDAIWHKSALCDGTGQKVDVPQNATVRLWHPLFDTIENVQTWRRFLEESSILQPFKQAHREIYLLTDAELQTDTYSNRFAAHILRQHQMRALCQARGWHYGLQIGDSLDYAEIALPVDRWKARFYADAVYDGPQSDMGVWLYVATDQVRFLQGEATMSLSDVPPLLFSETMRDVDLFVGVASVGNDPTWQDGGENRYRDYWQEYSFGDLSQTAQTRRDLLSRLLPKLKIAAQCELEGRFLRVAGKLRNYKIHLGSGNILMEPNDQYLCIVPERGQKSEKIFLPFEGDQTLSVILSKAFLLAEDDKITDPTIVRQIQ